MKASFFDALEAEHHLILEGLDCLDQALSLLEKSSDLVSCNQIDALLKFFGKYADEFHHGKEEDVLFPAAFETGVPRQGGPKCSYFFGLKMDFDHLGEVKKDIQRVALEIPPYPLKDFLIPLEKAKSPLMIPLQDHATGYYSLSVMNLELDRRKKTESVWDPTLFIRTARRYLRMLKLHIQKEEECLFMVLKERFSPADLEKLNQMGEKFDGENEEISRIGCSILMELKKDFTN